ncbi:MAG TPA: hypothetical protein VEB21_17905 [Terriglobales bacterium]|nr:hypothetical protein [Terriglobales bacterium]
MQARLRTIAMVIGAIFAIQGLGWLVLPEMAAGMLGMPPLEGMARSTQFGDFAAFFLFVGTTIFLGCRPGHGRILYFPAALLATAAFGRIIAWAFHDAVFATAFVIVEVICAAVLLMTAQNTDAS